MRRLERPEGNDVGLFNTSPNSWTAVEVEAEEEQSVSEFWSESSGFGSGFRIESGVESGFDFRFRFFCVLRGAFLLGREGLFLFVVVVVCVGCRLRLRGMVESNSSTCFEFLFSSATARFAIKCELILVRLCSFFLAFDVGGDGDLPCGLFHALPDNLERFEGLWERTARVSLASLFSIVFVSPSSMADVIICLVSLSGW